MRVLIIKTSSLGDVIHTLPALTDALHACPTIQFDWVLEESFQEIPKWHPAVDRVLPVALRRFRKHKWKMLRKGELIQSLQAIREKKYDMVIDAQGLLKSAALTMLSRSPLKAGFSWRSARESLSSLFYKKHAIASWDTHAVLRNRILFANSLGYVVPKDAVDYGIDCQRLPTVSLEGPYCVFLHGTTWATKHWPEIYWQQLAQKVAEAGFKIQLLWGTEIELARAKKIAAVTDKAFVVATKLSLVEVAAVLASARGIVTVDTGLGHLAAAVGVPTVSLYGPTDPGLSGTYGQQQLHLASQFPCAPCFNRECTYTGEKTQNPQCFAELSPEKVWSHLAQQIQEKVSA